MVELAQYQSELGEDAIKIVLEQWFTVTLEKIPETNGVRTPDYEIRDKAGKGIAMCEVKSLVDANVPSYDPNSTPEDIVRASERRERSRRGKLERHHSKAISQLARYRSLPALIVFVSFDGADYEDMGIFLQEYQTSYPDAPMADLYLLIKIHQKLIPSDTFTIMSTSRLMYTTDLGDKFGHRYLSLTEAVRNAGYLPEVFHLSAAA